jgi:hypothetical protein
MLNIKKSLGIYYGYPECCIREFHAVMFETDPAKKAEMKKRRKLNHAVSNGTGFIPCDHHTALVHSGAIVLSELIQNRICERPFTDCVDLKTTKDAAEKYIRELNKLK